LLRSLGLQLSSCRRSSLARAKSCNVYSQFDNVSTESRNSSLELRALEAAHREQLKSLRRRLTTLGTCPASEEELLRFAEEVSSRVLESATLTTTWRRWISGEPLERLSGWLTRHQSASTLYASAIADWTASGRTFSRCSAPSSSNLILSAEE
jgi:uncharacterized protein YciI